MQSFNEIVLELQKINNEYKKLCEMLEYEEVVTDKKLFLFLNKKKNSYEHIVTIFNEYQKVEKNIKDLDTIINSDDPEKCEFIKEKNIEEQKKIKFQQELIKLYNVQNAINEQITIEIVKNKEEQSSKLANILVEGYTNFLKKNLYNYNLKFLENSVFIDVSGENIAKIFEDEKGTHKIISKNVESSCCVFCYKNNKEKSYNFTEDELEISVCRSSGAGGQHINKTESAVKIVHKPTGLIGKSQDERSQFQNKQKAMERLKEKVENFINLQKEQFITTQKKQQLKEVKKLNKLYNLDLQIVVNNKKRQISLQNFLNGDILF